MGQKVHPVGIRLGIVREWNARWYADSKDYSRFLHQDIQMRKVLNKELNRSSVSRIQIERLAKSTQVTIHTAKPGAVIGKKGESIEKMRTMLEAIVRDDKNVKPVNIKLEEIRNPELDAYLVADSIAKQLEKRIQFRRAMKRALASAMRLGVQGMKVMVSGRLNGADIARTEWYREGRVPLHTFRADIDYAQTEGLTVYGQIGVKVWIYKGEVHDKSSIYFKNKSVRADRRGGK